MIQHHGALNGAGEVYLASLMAVDVDSPAEENYLKRLAERLGLDADEEREGQDKVWQKRVEQIAQHEP